jgi:hypothetical protein
LLLTRKSAIQAMAIENRGRRWSEDWAIISGERTKLQVAPSSSPTTAPSFSWPISSRPTIRPGDTLIVTRIDRLARSIGDLQDIVRELRRKGAALKATEQPIDTSTATPKPS